MWIGVVVAILVDSVSFNFIIYLALLKKILFDLIVLLLHSWSVTGSLENVGFIIQRLLMVVRLEYASSFLLQICGKNGKQFYKISGILT